METLHNGGTMERTAYPEHATRRERGTMTEQQAAAISIESLPAIAERAIRAYYRGDFAPLLDLITDDCVFIGAAADVYSCREDIERSPQPGCGQPTFSMSNPVFQLIPTHVRDQALIMGTYLVTSDFNAPMITAAQQRITISCRLIDASWKAYCIHASNEWNEADAGELFPERVSRETFAYVQSILRRALPALESQGRLELVAGSSSTVISPSQLLYAESDGKRTVLHLFDRTVSVSLLIGEVERQLPNYFIRIHRRYLVNARQVNTIEPQAVTLADGTTLSLPSRRAAAIRQEITAAQA